MVKTSIIVPVYNTAKYLRECFDSIYNQTQKEIEVIVVYKESTDDSMRVLEEIQKEHPEMIIVRHEKGGLGGARNIGLLKATGEYILFADSDDWLDKQCIENLYNGIRESDADYAMCSSYYINDGTDIYWVHGVPEGLYQTEEEKAILLCGNFICAWGKLYRREWMLKNQLMSPEIGHYEDLGLYSLIVCCAEKIYVSAKPCGHYRKHREGCLTLDDESVILSDFGKSMLHMFDYLDTHEKWERVRGLQAYYCWKDFYGRYLNNLKSGNKTAASILEHIKSDILLPRFGDLEPKITDYIVLGSFSLRWEVQKGCIANPKVDRHFCFSSLISICSDVLEMDVSHENSFRQVQIQQEMESSLLYALTGVDEKTLLFLDILEERFDVLELGQGVYMTESDAFRESNLNGLDYARRIKSGSDEHMALWRQACDKFAGILKKYVSPEQIVLVKNRMSCTYGNFEQKQMYEGARELERINQMLEAMEAYFIEHIQGITVLDIDEEYSFTDDMFKWGCRPEYANSAQYLNIGLKIFKERYGT